MARKKMGRMEQIQAIANAVDDSSMARTIRQEGVRREKVRAVFAPRTMSEGSLLRTLATSPRLKRSGPPLKKGAPKR